MSHRYREELAGGLDRLLRSLSGVRRGVMFGHPAFFAGRRMFACVYGDGVAVRLRRDDACGTAASVREFRPNGRTMLDWVLLVYEDDSAVARDRHLFERAIEILHARLQ